MDGDAQESPTATERRWGRVLLAALAVAVVAYLASIPLGLVRPDRRLGVPEAVLVAAVFVALLAAVGCTGYVLRGLTLGASGMSLQLDRIERRQDVLETNVRALQVALTALISKYELTHLEKLSAEGPAWVRFGQIMIEELERLDSIQFLVPRDRRGINAIREDQSFSTDDFDLKKYVELTTQGREYLSLRAALAARFAASAAAGSGGR